MNIALILSIIFIHWVADFVLQTPWQAENKSTDNNALTEHVAVYAGIWMGIALVWGNATNNALMLLFGPITFACHWATDYYTSRGNKAILQQYEDSPKKWHNFFVSVGFDQFLHYVQLFITWKVLTR